MSTTGSPAREEAAPYGAGVAAATGWAGAGEGPDPHLQEMKQRGEKFSVLTSYGVFTGACQVFFGSYRRRVLCRRPVSGNPYP
jgi:hypothetical protein